MKKHRIVLTLVLAVFAALPLLAQQALPLDASLPKLSNVTFGWASMSGLDPTLEMFSTFAPPIIALKDAGYSYGLETAIGQFNFNEFEVTSDFESAIAPLGGGLMRVSHYGYRSNKAEIVGAPGTPLQTRGDAIEVSYTQRFKDTTLGVSVVPQDNTSVTVDMGPITIASGTVNTKYGLRAGFIQRFPDNFRVGYDYSYQKDTGSLLVNPVILSGLGASAVDTTGWIEMPSADFITRVSTIGASWKFSPTTMIYSSYQDISAKGGPMDRSATQLWAGIQHNFAPNVVGRVNYLDGGQNYSVALRTDFGLINFAYTHNALMNARSFLGKGDAAFVGYAVAF